MTSPIIDKAMEEALLRRVASPNARASEEIERYYASAVKAWTVALIAACLAAIFAVLFVRARADRAGAPTLDNSACSNTYCAKKPSDGGWVCSDSVEELEKLVAEPPSIFGSPIDVVIL